MWVIVIKYGVGRIFHNYVFTQHHHQGQNVIEGLMKILLLVFRTLGLDIWLLVFLLLIHWFLLCLWRLQRNSWREEEKRPRYLLNFNFIPGFNNHSVREEILPESKVLKYTSNLQWLISPNWLFLYCWFQGCQLTSNRHNL